MKHTLKSIVAVVLSVMLLLMFPVSASAEELSSLYNADLFVELNEKANRTATYPTYLYNGSNLPADKIIKIAGDGVEFDFTIDGGMALDENDILDITSSTTVSLSGKPIKYIGIIANGSTQGGEVEFVVNFKSGDTQSYNFELSAMNTASTYYYEFGKSLKKSESGLTRKFIEGTDTTYLNLFYIYTESISEIESIEFKKADFSYHIVSIAEIPYTQQEIDDIKNQATLELLPVYREKNLVDITDADKDNLALIMSAITSGHADYEHISNLYTGYPLFSAQSKIKADYDAIMNVRNYLEAKDSDIEDSEAENLDKLIALYDAQASSDRETLENVMTYFNMTDDIFLDTDEKEIIEALKADYLIYKEKKDLKAEITSKYDLYKDKTTEELNDSDIEVLNNLIASYDKADEIGVEYEAAERAYIEKLAVYYTNYKTSENNIHYDLSSYYNTAFIAEEGEKLPKGWGVNEGTKVDIDGDGEKESTVNTGFSRSVWTSKQDENGVVKATHHVNYTATEAQHSPVLPYDKNKTDNKNTFKLSQNTKATDLNIIKLPSASAPIVVKGSGRLTNTLDVLSVGGANMGTKSIVLKINFKDGTVQENKISVVWSGYTQNSVNGMYDTAKPFNNGGYAAKTGSNSSSRDWKTRAFAVPVPAGKIIDSIEMSSTN